MKIGKDKIAHFIYSTWGAAFFTIVGITITGNKSLGVLIGFAVMFSIGLYKEFLYDRKQGKGCFEILDLVADILGSAAGALFVYFLYQ